MGNLICVSMCDTATLFEFVDVTVSLVFFVPKSLEKTVLYHGVTL